MAPTLPPRHLASTLCGLAIMGGLAHGLPNDQFAAAADLGAESSIELSLDASQSTRQVGEPTHAFDSSTGTLWWSWTAPADGVWEVDFVRFKDGLGYRFALYTGDALDALTLVDDESGRALVVDVQDGQEYKLVLVSNSWATLRATFTGRPPNDDFANPADLGAVAMGSVTGSTVAATLEAEEPAHAGDSSLGGSIWWEWTAPEDGILRYDILGTELIDWHVVAYSGETLASLVERGRRTASTALDEEVEIRVTGGERILLAAARNSPGSTGEVQLNFALESLVNNDAPEDAVNLGAVTMAEIPVNPIGATPDEGASSPTLWWSWTAPGYGWLSLRSPDSFVDFALFRRLPDDSLEKLVNSSIPNLYVRAGEEVLIQIESRFVASATLTFRPAPANDGFENAAPLVMGLNPFNLLGAGADAGQPTGNTHPSLWWHWTAPADGALVVRQVNYHAGLEVGLYSGTEPSSLVAINGDDLLDEQRWPVRAGQTYILLTSAFTSLDGTLDAVFVPKTTGHDDFADAADLGSGWEVRGYGDTAGSTVEAGEPAPHHASVWWKWTAPADAVVHMVERRPDGISEDLFMRRTRVYQGASVDTLGNPVFPVPLPAFPWFEVTGGTTYHIAVARQQFEQDAAVDFVLRAYPLPPPNDHFANATDLGSVTAHDEMLSFVGANLEAGEPDYELPLGLFAEWTRWWSWTAPEDLNVEVTIESGSDNLLGIYQGDRLATLVPLQFEASRNDRLARRFSATAGQTYRIVLASGGDETAFSLLTWTSPPGDRFADAIILTEEGQLQGDATGTAIEPGEPEPSFPYYGSRWWRWTAPVDGLFRLTQRGLAYGEWRLFQGNTLSTLTELPGLEHVMTAGEEIVILYQGSESGEERITLDFRGVPVNDDFASATDLGSGPATAETEFYSSSLEPGEPGLVSELTDGTPFIPGSVWWSWTAPAHGALHIHADYPSGASGEVTAVFRGSDLSNLELVALDDDHFHDLKVPVDAGETVYLAMALPYVQLSDNRATIEVEFLSAPDNDVWHRATDLGDQAVASGTGTTVDATREFFEGDAAEGGSAWWTWRAPADGVAVVVADITNEPEVVQIYRADAPNRIAAAHMTSLARSQGAARAVPVSAGEQIWISVAGEQLFDNGAVEVGVFLGPRVANDIFAAAQPAPAGQEFLADLTFSGATGSADDPDPFGTGGTAPSTWWTWTAPTSGTYALESTVGGVAIFTGTDPAALTEVALSSAGVTIWETVAGTAYHFLLASTGFLWTGGDLMLSPVQPPANDAFAAAQILGALPAMTSGRTLAATAEPGEPAHGGTPATHTVWFEWTTGADGSVRLNASGAIPPTIAVYTGGSLNSLVEVASAESELIVEARAGTTYRIAISSAPGEASSFELALDPILLPTNDLFADRIVLTGNSIEFGGDLTLATKEASEYPGPTSPPLQTLWWQWTAPRTTNMDLVQLDNSLVELYYYAPRRPATNLRLLGSGQRMSGGRTYRVYQGVTYFFQLGTRRQGDSVAPKFRFFDREAPEPPDPGGGPGPGGPPNDHFTDRFVLGSPPHLRTSAIDLRTATREEGEPTRIEDVGVWWSWTAPASGHYEFAPFSTSRATTGLYTGSDLLSLTRLSAGRRNHIIHVEAGTEIQVAMSMHPSELDRFSDSRAERSAGFEISPAPSYPSNDDFAAREDLGNAGYVFRRGHNVEATAEPGEPAHGGEPANATIWYTWTAPAGRPVEARTGGTRRIAVYSGSEVDNLTLVATENTNTVTFEPVAGTTYAIALDGDWFTQTWVRIDQEEDPVAIDPPVNDHFENATVLQGGDVQVPGTLLGATLQPGEPQPDGYQFPRSAWWSWTAPADGPVSIERDGAGSVRAAVYTGNDLQSLNLLLFSLVDFRFVATAGTTYHIAVGDNSSLPFALTVRQDNNSPANDSFGSPTTLIGADVTVEGTTVGSSWEPGEPSHRLLPGICASTVWYEWLCPGTADYTVAHTLNGFHCLAVYTGDSLGDLALVATDTPELRFRGEAGTTYRIAVADTHPDDFTLTIRSVAHPANDDFASRIDLGSLLDTPVTGSTVEATREEGEPLHAGDFSPGGSVWWSWTAPDDGPVSLDAIASDDQLNLAVYTGESLSALTLVSQRAGRSLQFDARAGTTYQLALSAQSIFSFAVGAVSFILSNGVPPNDLFLQPTILPSELPIAASGPTLGATVEFGEPRHGNISSLASIWWQWTAPTSETVDLVYQTDGPTSVRAGVYTGEVLPFLEPASTTEAAFGVLRFEAVAGTTYHLALAVSTHPSPVTFELLPARPVPVNDAFAGALPLSGETATFTTHTWGAGVEPGEPEDHERSLWWRWTAPRATTVWVRGSGTPRMYRGSSLDDLQEIPAIDADGRRFQVAAGVEYFIALNVLTGAREVTLELETGPPGDFFDDAIALPSSAELSLEVDLREATPEFLEPWHYDGVATNSIWARWTAPFTGRFTLRIASIGDQRIAIYRGIDLRQLVPVAEGEAPVTFDAIAGTEYQIAIDAETGRAGSGPYRLDLTTEESVYSQWAMRFFPNLASPQADPGGNPDRDAFPNLFELALGLDPLQPDPGEIPLRVTVENGLLVLRLTHPRDVEGIQFDLEVSADAGRGAWSSVFSLPRQQSVTRHADNTQTLEVILLDVSPATNSEFFARVRVTGN